MTAAPCTPADPVDPGLLSRALEVAGRLANDAAEVIAGTAARGGRGVGRGGGHFDWITDTERTLERHTRRVLAGAFPGIPLVGGRLDGRLASPGRTRYRWTVAPVDGMANYAAGLPWYAFGLALLDERGPVVGVLSDPSRAEIYAAARGRGMRANGIPVRLSGPPAPGLPVCTEWGPHGGWPGLPAFLARAGEARREVRVLGSAALAVTQVALGHAAAAVLPDQPECAVAPALALAAEAGAVVLDDRGRTCALPTGRFLVAAPAMAPEVLQWWRPSP